ncbi:hypothetical protein NMY22_g12404 [Coprinellus aureogranulatus]|nr:hypothetical protein NMY22_g12404 [Coprinellus aureogranulatus]
MGHTLNVLPTQVLVKIFAHYISIKPTSWNRWDFEAGDVVTNIHYHSPFLLRQVCKLWNDVVTGQPSLWSQLYIRARFEESDEEYYTSPNDIDKSQAQIALTKDLSLSLNLDLAAQPDCFGYRSPMHSSLAGFLDRDSEAFTNLQRLHIHDTMRHSHISPEVGLSVLPNLEFLFVDHVLAAKDSRDDIGTTLTASLPRLPALKRLAGTPIHLNSLPTTIPWHQLIHLHLESPLTSDEIFAVLQHTPTLRVAGFKRHETRGSTILPSPLKRPKRGTKILLPNLSRLSFVGQLFDNDMDSERKGVHLSWPKLTHFRLIPDHAPPMFYQESILSQWVPQLTHLSITDSNSFHISQLTRILRFCRHLIHLGFGVYNPKSNHREVFDFLTYNDEEPRLPKLRELGIHLYVEKHACWSFVGGQKEVTLESMWAMVESRDGTQTVPAALERLVISVGGVHQYQRARVTAIAIEKVLRFMPRQPAFWRVVRERVIAATKGFDSTFEGEFEDWRGSRIADVADDFGTFAII